MRIFIRIFTFVVLIILLISPTYSLQQYSAIEFGSSFVDNSSPLIADIIPDIPGKEIAVGCLDGFLYVFDCQGNQLFKYDAKVGIDSSPAAADIDNDGYLEIVFGVGSLDTVNTRNYHGGIIVIRLKYDCDNEIVYGEEVWSYRNTPIEPVGEFGGPLLPFKIPENLDYVVPDGKAEFMESTPAIANVDDDPELEIFIGCLDFNFYGFNYDGTLIDNRIDDDGDGRINEDPGYIREGSGSIDDDGDCYGVGIDDCNTIYQRQCMDEDPPDWPIDNQDTIFSSAAIGDIDKDGEMEIIFGGDSSQPTGGGSFCPDGGKLWFLKPGGTSERPDDYPLPIGSKEMPNGNVVCKGQIFASSPALADVNNDGFLEIFIGTGNYPPYYSSADTQKVFGFNYFGQDLSGWPYDCGSGQMTRSSPAIGDVNGDGRLDVIICSGDIDTTRTPKISKIHAIDAQTGQALPGFPVVPFDQPYVISSPVIADVNNDMVADIVVGINNRIFAYDGWGRQLMHVQALSFVPFQNSLAVDDIDNDGKLEIVGASSNLNYTGGLFIIEAGAFNPMTLHWPMFRNNLMRTGYPRYDSKFISNTFPSKMRTGEVRYDVTLTVKNTGTESWSKEKSIKLGAIGNSDYFYSKSRVNLPSGVVVNPGQTYTFTISPFKAPSVPRTYPSDWKMLQEGVKWFGDKFKEFIEVKSNNIITVTSPNGGESWQRGNTYNITWTSTGSIGNNLRITLWRGNTLYKTLVNPITNISSYAWPIPASLPTGSDYRIRITSNTDGSIYDFSDDYFKITPCITITSPNGGESWQRGTTHNITWESSGNVGNNLRITLWKGNTLNKTLVNPITNIGSYTWPIPSSFPTGSDYRVRITSNTNGSIYDFSDNYFAIALSSLYNN